MSSLLLHPILHALACLAVLGLGGLALWLLPWTDDELAATTRSVAAARRAGRQVALVALRAYGSPTPTSGPDSEPRTARRRPAIPTMA